MNTRIRNLVIGAFATATVMGALAPLAAHAATPNSPTVKAEHKAAAKNLSVQVSKDGYEVMHDVRAARLALFDGNTDQATKLVDQAQQKLIAARNDEKAVGNNSKGDPNLISIDGQLVVGHDYVATPEKTAHLKQGNEQLKAGKNSEAIEQLKLADVDIGYTRILMPLAETQKHVDEAAALLYSKNYYDANMALKQAEEGLDTETVLLVEAPKPANHTDTAQAQAHTPAKTAVN
jgi:hypothetical protein